MTHFGATYENMKTVLSGDIMIKKLFRRKNKNDILNMELPKYNFNSQQETLTAECQQPIVPKNERIERLVTLIEQALNQWSVEYHMEKVPKRIIFEQALDVMRALDNKMNVEANLSFHCDYSGGTNIEHSSDNHFSNN